MRRLLLLAGLVVAGTALAGCTGTEPTPHDRLVSTAEDVAKDIDTPEEARAAGYEPGRHCIPGMGVHWTHKPGAPDSRVDTEIEVARPEVVIFEPQTTNLSDPDEQSFLGIEYVLVTEGTNRNSSEALPKIEGVPLQGPMAGHQPGMPWHADLHVYLRDDVASPEGFPPTRDAITCPNGTTAPKG